MKFFCGIWNFELVKELKDFKEFKDNKEIKVILNFEF